MGLLSVGLFAWHMRYACNKSTCFKRKAFCMLPRLIAIHVRSIAVGSSVIASTNWTWHYTARVYNPGCLQWLYLCERHRLLYHVTTPETPYLPWNGFRDDTLDLGRISPGIVSSSLKPGMAVLEFQKDENSFYSVSWWIKHVISSSLRSIYESLSDVASIVLAVELLSHALNRVFVSPTE